jgi:hypothetical protein
MTFDEFEPQIDFVIRDYHFNPYTAWAIFFTFKHYKYSVLIDRKRWEESDTNMKKDCIDKCLVDMYQHFLHVGVIK